jgi:eukaryotic-like serine/threonine-protein kinase
VTTRIRAGAPEPAEPSIIGEVIDGRYRVDELIGEGGMGRVYRAEQLHLKRPVAVKVLRRAYSAIPEVGRRFEREALALARLDHPNCVAVQDFGRLADGSLYLVMSFLRGEILRNAMHRERLSMKRALHVARHLLSGLAHAHNAGIVHRDLKPENVMLVQHEGDPDFAKLFDFGIVKLLDAPASTAGAAEGENLTQVGQRFGTPAYMSPEQSLGKSVDARSDLYSLTVLLYETLTGRALFAADDEESLLVMHAAKAPPALDAEFPAALRALVARGLAKSPDERPANAGEYLAALDACTAAPEPKPPSRAARLVGRPLWQMMRSRRAVSWLAALLVLAALAVTLKLALRPDHAAHARALLAAGRPQEAAAYLQERLADIADDARAQLELGHAYAASHRYDEALVAYERVRSLDRKLADDRAMRTNLMLMLDDERNETAAGAARFLIQLLDDEGARARVVELASHDPRSAHRAAMRDLSEGLALTARVDLLASYRLDLEQGATCPDRQLAVSRLRALRDPAAVAALKKAQARKLNACLRSDAADAVRYLESLGAAEPPTD